MTADAFLDTNVLVNAFDRSTPAKRDRARELIYGGAAWAVSWQVVQEFCAAALHRFKTPMLAKDLRDYLDLVLMPHCRVMPTASLYQQALTIHKQTQYRFYDSLIVASALLAGAKVLYSEDLQHGRAIGGLRVENPFLV
jgi:predicted nucleic acid-binding protein